jgi:hypothetical protein
MTRFLAYLAASAFTKPSRLDDLIITLGGLAVLTVAVLRITGVLLP